MAALTFLVSFLLCGPLWSQIPTARASLWREDLQFLSANLRVLHPNAFFRTPQADFDSAVRSLDQAIPALSDVEITTGFAGIVAMIGDGHTSLPLQQAQARFRQYPIRLHWFSDGLFVTAATSQAERALGQRVLGIGGLAIDQVIDRVRTVISHENPYWLERVSADYVVIPEVLFALRVIPFAGPAPFEFDDGAGGSLTLDIAPLASTSGVEWLTWPAPDRVAMPLYRRDPGLFYWYQYLSVSRTLYLKFNVCGSNDALPFSGVVTQMLEIVDTMPVDRVVIDLRNNGGGNSSQILPLLGGLEQRAAAGRFNLGTGLVALTGRETFSAAVDNAILIQTLTGRLIGEPTGGKPNAYGNVQQLTLPHSQLSLQYSTRYFRRLSDDPATLTPTTLVPMSSADYLQGRDPVLEAALAGALPSTTATRLALHRGGGTLVEVSSENPTVTVGHASIEAAGRAPAPRALAVFRNRVGGITVSEATVPAEPSRVAGRIFAERSVSVRTGIALANASSAPVTVSFLFTDPEGRDYGHGSLPLAPNSQIARFLDEEPFRLPADTMGTFTFNATLPVAVTALRGLLNERSEFLITTLPVVSLGMEAPGNLVLPHFARGGGWLTEFLLVNSTDSPESGVLSLVSSAGRPLASLTYAVAPRGAQRLLAPGETSEVLTGSVSVMPGAGSMPPALSAVLRFERNGVTVSEGAVTAAAPSTTARLFIDGAGAFTAAAPGSLMSGVAIANPSSSPATAQLTLHNLDGSVFARTSLLVGAGGQASRFLKELPGFEWLQTPIRGVLAIGSTTNIVVTGIRGRYNERGDFLFASTPPLSEAPSESTIHIPHLAQGGGYTTQFFIVEPSSAAAATMNLRLFDSRGNPLSIHLR